MFLNKMNRLATNCDVRATTRFLRRIVSADGPLREITKDDDVDHLSLKEQAGLFTPKTGDLRSPEVARMVDVFAKCAPFNVRITNKDPRVSLDQAAAGIRAFTAIKALLAKHEKSVEGLTFAILGFENFCLWIALLVHEAGGKVVALGDQLTGVVGDHLTGVVKNKKGIDINALLKHINSKGNLLADFSGGDHSYSMGADELLASECDVLIPVNRPLSRKNAADVKAKFVVKNVHYPYYPDSDEILCKKGVVILDKSGVASTDDSSDEELRESYVQNAFDRLIKKERKGKPPMSE